MRPARPIKHGRFFYSKAKDCARCPLRECLSKGRVNKAVVVGDDYPALLRARRRRQRWSEEDRRLYHRWRSEGFHGEAKTWHGLARAVRRGLANTKIQSNLTAAAIIKRLAAALLALLLCRIVPRNPFAIPPSCQRAGRRNGGFFNDPIVHWYRNVFSHVPSTKVKLARAFRYDLSLLRRADPLVTLQPQC